jgi:hypothetical protein
MTSEERFYELQDIRDQIVDLLHQAKGIIDETPQREYAKAYVWGNLFAEEFGYLGKAGGDYLNEVIEGLRDSQ